MANRLAPDDLPAPEEWSDPERHLWSAFRDGGMLDLRTGAASDDDPAGGAGWGPERQIRALVIAQLLLEGSPARPR